MLGALSSNPKLAPYTLKTYSTNINDNLTNIHEYQRNSTKLTETIMKTDETSTTSNGHQRK